VSAIKIRKGKVRCPQIVLAARCGKDFNLRPH
jgi:hypothetical protein